METHDLFKTKTLKDMSSGIKLTPTQKNKAKQWIESGYLVEEKKRYFDFRDLILCLFFG